MRAVSLPDLSQAAEAVRAQLRERYASLTAAIRSSGTSVPDRAAAYGEMGKLFMAAEYRDEAEACLINAQTLAPQDFRWPYYLAQLYKASGRPAESTHAFERALQLQPGDVPALVWLGNAYLDQGRPEAAEPLFARARSAQPRSTAAAFGAGRAALARSDYARAVRHLEEALALDPRAAAIHYPLAMAYRGLGQTERAEGHMRERAPGEIRPPDPLMLDLESLLESPVAYEVRGARALDAGDWKTAAANFRKGIALAPGEPSLRHKLGTALFLAGDGPAAMEQFETALRVSPHFAKAHYSLGVLMGSSGRIAPAIDHLSAAVRDDPAYVEARLRLADVLRRSGRAAESLSHYEQAATLDPRMPDARFGHAMALVDLHRYREARDRLIEDAKRYPDHPPFAHALVRLLAAAPDDRVRDGAQALTLMRGLLAREPRDAELAEMMAMAQAEIGQFGEAVIWQREAIAAAERAGQHRLAQRLAGNLGRYQQRQPCRTPWQDENFGR